MKVAALTTASSVVEAIREQSGSLSCHFVEHSSLAEALTGCDIVFLEWSGATVGNSAVLGELQKAKSRKPPVYVVLLLPPVARPLLQRAHSFGARDALLLPPHVSEIRAEILDAIRFAHNEGPLVSEKLRRLRDSSLIGTSEVFERALSEIPAAAHCDANVLLLGETGTGKELFARAIHELSDRSIQPYVAVNCAALVPTLVESELFGHARGAFTGALQRHRGRFEAVGGGTLLLDEIGDVESHVQTKLLRAIEERLFQPVGQNESLPFKGRIIAATSKNLETAIEKGTFRRDLFSRLNQIQIRLPSLRDRAADIPVLAQHFVGKHSAGRPLQLSPTTTAILQHSDYPMNVRQLENVIRSAVVRCDNGELILPRHLPDELRRQSTRTEIQTQLSYSEAREAALRAVDKEYLPIIVARNGGNMSAAAEELGIDRKTFATRLRAAEQE